jgi:3-deoxy-D-manno-octulosonic-acid transferase
VSQGQTPPGAIWLHAVSVGEVLSSVELLRRLRERFPRAPLFVSTTTLAGRAIAEQRLAGLADGVFFAPLDYCFSVRRVLRALRPRAVVVLETEIWPNLYREARRAGCALLIVNARISDRAEPRYRRARWFIRQALALPHVILAQDETNYRRFLALGAPAKTTRVAGNLKYDFRPSAAEPPREVRALLDRVAPEEIWIAASTMPPAAADDPDEDEVVIDAFRKLAPSHPRLLLILAPRKPERFDTAAGMLARAGVAFLRRSALSPSAALALPGVLLLDSMGELSSLFGAADVVFMGGTLARRGGHNILEPAFFRRAIVAGPHMENFAAIEERFAAAGAMREIREGGELAGAIHSLLADRAAREALGGRAYELASSERGATARAVDAIEEHYWRALPRSVPPARRLLAPLARLWIAGARLKRRRDLARRVRLSAPVVSVGGITAGGAGKSPLVLWLAKRLHDAGCRPAILTRGYRRRSPEPHTIVAPGEAAPAARTGDEAQAFVRAGFAFVGIGADRAAAGSIIEQRFDPGVFLLDDGFQHARLERSLDIVALDALDPFGGGAAIPLGRLREPLDALARAGIVVVTHVEPGQPIDAIVEVVRRYNPAAPVFAARLVAEGWEPAPPPGPAAAFCGLGNPASFWQTLAAMGLRPALRRAFPDHHRYTADELRRLAAEARAAGAAALLTTEKDFANLPEDWRQAVHPLPVCRLRIQAEVDRAEEFEAAVLAALSKSSRNLLRSSPKP